MNGTKTLNSSEYKFRMEKAMLLKQRGEGYVNRYARSHTLLEASALPEGTETSVCGRVVGKRSFGKFMFLSLMDLEGNLQLSFNQADLGSEPYRRLNEVDIADFIGAAGVLYRTKTGELTVRVQQFTLLSKALRPLPEKFHGIQDAEIKYRQRYLDLIASAHTRDVFLKRSKTVSFIRRFLDSHGFLEVETPILQPVASGAAAKPFHTHHNALDCDFFLRIAPELYLKQTVAGGFDRVYEIGKNFRNEGMDPSHLQEFTMLEWYSAYWDFKDNVRFTKDLLCGLAKEVYGSSTDQRQDTLPEWEDEWPWIDYCATISQLVGADILSFNHVEDMRVVLAEKNLFETEDLEKAKSISALIDLTYKRHIRPNLVRPTILYHYPACLIPLARRNDNDPRTIDMFQIVVRGWELVKGYSELVDPKIQQEAFEDQARNRNCGDDESFEGDLDFLLAMEHGMPPMSGVGIGIDRLVALFCNEPSLRDVVLFPTMK